MLFDLFPKGAEWAGLQTWLTSDLLSVQLKEVKLQCMFLKPMGLCDKGTVYHYC